jgi:hypothetical protein
MLEDIIFLVMGILIGAMIIISLIGQEGIATYDTIVNHQCAEYNTTTGEFQWLNLPQK